MMSTCDKHTTDIISLKRPTGLDKLIESIPKPKGAIPNFGLPKWKVMPLESKIPMVPGPEGAYNFTRRKIGKELWIPAPDAEFNLTDPYCYEMELTYDSLHDKHLVPYFSRPNNIQRLIKTGLVTKNLDAKCSLRDYNMYRKYLRKLHCDSIKKELNKRSKWSTEERAIRYAQEQAQKEVIRLKERDKLMKLRRTIIRNRKIAEKLRLEKQKEMEQKVEERLHMLLLKRQQVQDLQRIKSKTRAEHIRQKQKAAADRERHKIIQTLLEWRRKERIRKKTREMRLSHEQEEKRKLVQQKWEKRHEFQKKQIEKEQFLLQCIDDQRKHFIQAYNDKINRETERMKRLLKDVKMFVKCYLARRYAGGERICCEKGFNDHVDKNPVSSVKSDKRGHRSKLMRAYTTPMKRDTDKVMEFLDCFGNLINYVTKHRQLDRNYILQRIKYPDQKVPQTTKKTMKENKNTMSKKRNERKIEKDAQTKTKEKHSKARKKKKYTVRKSGKRRTGKRRRLKTKIDEEEKPELETIGESVSTIKTIETSEAATASTPTEKCRCQTIKDSIKAVAT